MKKYSDCLRDVLFAVNSLPEDHNALGLSITGYSEEEVSNAVKDLYDQKLIKAVFVYMDGQSYFNVYGLTGEGRKRIEEYRTNLLLRFFKTNGKEILAFLWDQIRSLLPFPK